MCKTISKDYLIVVNVLFCLLGLALGGVSIYALVQYDSIDAAFPRQTFALSCGLGFSVFVVGAWGAHAARKQSKCMLALYVLVMGCLVGAQVYAGAHALRYAQQIDAGNNAPTPAASGSPFNQLLECSYDYCCKPLVLNPACSDLAQWVKTGDNAKVCGVLPDDFRQHGDGCDGGFDKYRAGVVAWFKKHEKPIAIATLSVGGVEFLAVIAAVALLCMDKGPHKALSEEERQNLYVEHRLEGGTVGYEDYGATSGLPIAVATAPPAGKDVPANSLTYA